MRGNKHVMVLVKMKRELRVWRFIKEEERLL